MGLTLGTSELTVGRWWLLLVKPLEEHPDGLAVNRRPELTNLKLGLTIETSGLTVGRWWLLPVKPLVEQYAGLSVNRRPD